MEFIEKYTSASKVAADNTGKEKEKVQLSEEGFAIGEILSNLKRELGNLRLK